MLISQIFPNVQINFLSSISNQFSVVHLLAWNVRTKTKYCLIERSFSFKCIFSATLYGKIIDQSFSGIVPFIQRLHRSPNSNPLLCNAMQFCSYCKFLTCFPVPLTFRHDQVFQAQCANSVHLSLWDRPFCELLLRIGSIFPCSILELVILATRRNKHYFSWSNHWNIFWIIHKGLLQSSTNADISVFPLQYFPFNLLFSQQGWKNAILNKKLIWK